MKTKSGNKEKAFKEVAEKFITAKKAAIERKRLIQEKADREEKIRLQRFQQGVMAALACVNENFEKMISEEHGDQDFIEFLLHVLNQDIYHPHEDNMNLFGFGFGKDGSDHNAPIMGTGIHALVLNIYELETGPSTKQVLALAVQTERFAYHRLKRESLRNAHFVLVQQHIDQRTDAVDYDQVSFRHLDRKFMAMLYKLSEVGSTYKLFLKQFSYLIDS